MKCAHCGNEIDGTRFPSGLAFCPICGNALHHEPEKSEKLLFCPYCGQELFAETSFCPHCGKELAPPAGQGDAPEEHHETREFIGRAAHGVRGAFSKERKIKKLYQQWAEHSGLPPEELAAMELAAIEKPPEAQNRQSSNAWLMYLMLATALVIVIVGVVLLLV